MAARPSRALVVATLAALVLSAAGCGGGTGDPNDVPMGTGAPITPTDGTVPEPPPPTFPPGSGGDADCGVWPFALEVRTATGETRSVVAPGAYALVFNNGASWVIATGDVIIDPSRLVTTLPEPAGKVLVNLSLTGTGTPPPLKAGDVFTPPDPRSPPGTATRTVDVDVRTAKADTGPTAGLTGTVRVDSVSPERLCLTFDLARPAGAQAKGRVAARILPADAGVFKP